MNDPDNLIEECHEYACELLYQNLTPQGLMAASVQPSEESRGYHHIFGRDAAISAFGMVLTQHHGLIQGACAGLRLLGAHQASNGQIPKFVDPLKSEGDFWYLGCIDATLWWLLAVDFVTRKTNIDLRTEFIERIERALNWLHCQEHPRLYLLQQNEASDWADIMPRSGFVLYSNALWYQVKRIYQLPNIQETRYQFNHLFHPSPNDLSEYRRLRLLTHYIRKRVYDGELYLSFVNFSFYGKEGDVFGNLLAILFGLASHTHASNILRTLRKEKIDHPVPVRVTLNPIVKGDPLWRAYMMRHRQNLEYRYHNGGSWPFVAGFWIMALATIGQKKEAEHELWMLANLFKVNGWEFKEWYNGCTGEPNGMPGQSWNAAMFLLAQYALTQKIF